MHLSEAIEKFIQYQYFLKSVFYTEYKRLSFDNDAIIRIYVMKRRYIAFFMIKKYEKAVNPLFHLRINFIWSA